MESYWTLIIIGIYTCVYVVVFIIQQSQIKKQKELIATMEKYMGFINLDTIEKYIILSQKTGIVIKR